VSRLVGSKRTLHHGENHKSLERIHHQPRRHRLRDDPPGPAAKAAATTLLAAQAGGTDNIQPSTSITDSTVIDLSAYDRAAQKRTLK